MADDFVVVECEKCSTKFKIRAIALKITKDVKCPKCANRILVSTIKKQAPASATPATTSPAPVAPAPDAPPVAVPPPATLPPSAEARADAPAPGSLAPAPEAVQPAAPVPPSPAPVDTVNPALKKELDEAKELIRELEAKVSKLSGLEVELAAARQKIQELESRPPPPPPPPPAPTGSAADAEELKKAQQVISEQEERLTELQRLWYEKEKEARSGYDVASRASKEFDYVTTQFRTLMRSFHEAAIHSAETRLNELEGRIEMLIKEAKAKNGPPP